MVFFITYLSFLFRRICNKNRIAQHGYPSQNPYWGRMVIALRIAATTGRMFSALPADCHATAATSASSPFLHGCGSHPHRLKAEYS
jgi:hypothetical protein